MGRKATVKAAVAVHAEGVLIVQPVEEKMEADHATKLAGEKTTGTVEIGKTTGVETTTTEGATETAETTMTGGAITTMTGVETTTTTDAAMMTIVTIASATTDRRIASRR